jgi:hypothetical protein
MRHETRAQAKRVLRRMARARRRYGSASAVEVYRCRRCRGWHIGSRLKPPRVAPDRRRWSQAEVLELARRGLADPAALSPEERRAVCLHVSVAHPDEVVA